MFRCFSSYKGLTLLGIAVLVGGYLAIWHGQHLAALSPFLVLLACPLMHLFMHKNHGGTHHHTPHVDSHAQPGQSHQEKTNGQS
ncbi:MAG: DUF2933 domain-containing protein [Rhizobiales bacterium]|nr:DUF2933 domain-containing protein [Hyphomicrobiales bacterium]